MNRTVVSHLRCGLCLGRFSEFLTHTNDEVTLQYGWERFGLHIKQHQASHPNISSVCFGCIHACLYL